MAKIIIEHPKIIEFYENNKNIDIIEMNLAYINLYENIVNNNITDNKITTIIKNQNDDINKILTVINHQNEINKYETENVKNHINTINMELQNKIFQIKDEYVKEIKEIISLQEAGKNANEVENEDYNKILSVISHQNEINKYENEIVKSHINSINRELQNKLFQLKDEYVKEIKELITSQESGKNINELIHNSNKYLINDLTKLINESFPKNQTNDIIDIINKFTINPEDYNNKIINIQEKLVCDISNIKDIQTTMRTELNNYLNKYNNSSLKGSLGEYKLHDILKTLFPSCEIVDSSHLTAKGDFIVNRKTDSILFENKDYTNHVRKEEVEKFIRDVENNKCHGIFLSQHSGIVNKENFQIDVNSNSVLIYIHFTDYDPEKIKLAVSIIDIISSKLSNFITEEYSISKEFLENINTEYKNLNIIKQKLISDLKDYYKKCMENYNNMLLTTLETYLCNFYTSMKKNINVCDICGIAEFNNLKSLARHKTMCKKKHSIK